MFPSTKINRYPLSRFAGETCGEKKGRTHLVRCANGA